MEIFGYVMIGNKILLIQKVNYLNFVYKKKLIQFICIYLFDVLKYIYVYSNQRNFVLVNILKSVFFIFLKSFYGLNLDWCFFIIKLKEVNFLFVSICKLQQLIYR